MIAHCSFNFFLMLYLFTYLFLAVLGLHCCTGFSLVVVSGGYSPAGVHGLFIVVASLVVEHGLWGLGFSSCSPRAQ